MQCKCRYENRQAPFERRRAPHWWWVGGWQKRCEKLFAAMKPFCLNQIENIYIRCLLAFWSLVQMNVRSLLNSQRERVKRQGANCAQCDGVMESECFWILIIMAGGAFNSAHIQPTNFTWANEKRNWGCVHLLPVWLLWKGPITFTLWLCEIKASICSWITVSKLLATLAVNEVNGSTEQHEPYRIFTWRAIHNHITLRHCHYPRTTSPTTMSSTMSSGKVNFLFAFCTSTAWYVVPNNTGPGRQANL